MNNKNKSILSDSSSSACSSFESSMSVDVTLDTLANSSQAGGVGVKTLITRKTQQQEAYNFQHSTPSKEKIRELDRKIQASIVKNTESFRISTHPEFYGVLESCENEISIKF